MLKLCFQDVCSAGRHCLLDVDVEGVRSLKSYLATQEPVLDLIPAKA